MEQSRQFLSGQLTHAELRRSDALGLVRGRLFILLSEDLVVRKLPKQDPGVLEFSGVLAQAATR